MRKIFLSALFLVALLLIFGQAESSAECMLDAEFVDADGDDSPDIQFASKGRTVSGQLKVINNDETACKVKVSVRVYAGENDRIAVKSISYGTIGSGEKVTKQFSITSKRGAFYGKTLVAVLNPTVVQEDGEEPAEVNDGSVNCVLAVPDTAPDLSGEWITGPTLSKNNKKVTGQLKVSNLSTDSNDDAQNAGRFAVTFWLLDADDTPTTKVKKVYVNSLKAGEYRIINFSYSSQKSLQGLNYIVYIDSDNDIYESNELNNQASSAEIDIVSATCTGSNDSGIAIPSSMSFGSVNVGSSTTKKLKITKCAGYGLSWVDVTAWSFNGEDFKVDDMGGTIKHFLIVKSDSTEMGVIFTPTSTGVQSATLSLTITTDGSDGNGALTKEVVLTGTGI